MPDEAHMLLLVDGAFLPGLFRQIKQAGDRNVIFESLPGCSEATRDVSPFLVAFDPSDTSIKSLFHRCSGYPMMSAITTLESKQHFAERMAAWCVIEAGGQRFNLRYPDTRRLPAIFDVMSERQRGEFIGNTLSWRYIGRDGTWKSLPVENSARQSLISKRPALDGRQFNCLVGDSETDEIIVQLGQRGIETSLTRSQQYDLLSAASRTFVETGLDDFLRMKWFSECLKKAYAPDAGELREKLANWRKANV